MNEIVPVETTEVIQSELDKFKSQLKPITDVSSCKSAADNLKVVKFRLTEIDEKRKELVAPLNATVKKINDIFRPATQEYTALKENLSSEIWTFTKAEQEKQEKANAESGNELMVPKNIKSPWATTSMRDKWTYEIEDAGQVPHEFCSPDNNKIMVSIKSGTRKIKGLKIFNEGSVVTR
jgi:hypothetical protein